MQTVTGRRAYDGPSCRLSQSSETQISEFEVFWNETPSTVRRAHDGPSLGSSPQPVFPEIKSAAQND